MAPELGADGVHPIAIRKDADRLLRRPTRRVIDFEPGLSGRYRLILSRLGRTTLNQHFVGQAAQLARVLTNCRHRRIDRMPCVGVVKSEDRQVLRNPYADFVGLVDRPLGRERVGDKDCGRRRAEAHHLAHQLCAVCSSGGYSENEPLIEQLMGHQGPAVRLAAIDMVAVFRLIRRTVPTATFLRRAVL